jgi:hypothetical protein
VLHFRHVLEYGKIPSTEDVQFGTNSIKVVIDVDKWDRKWRSDAANLNEKLVVCRTNHLTSFIADTNDSDSRVDNCEKTMS